MTALELSAYKGLHALEVVEKPLPDLRQGQVLVRVEAAAVNPSDLMFIRGRYGFTKPLPVVPGFEASGRVVSGRGAYARALVGRRVACAVQQQGDGTWAEYVAIDAMACLPLLPSVSFEQGAALFVNPFTAYALLERARKARARAVVQTAAASALGHMVLRLAKRAGLPVIHIVRRDEQVERLKEEGARDVLNSETPDFSEQLRSKCIELDATLAFDAVGDDLSNLLVQAMPEGSTVIVYGALSEQNVTVSPSELIFRHQRVEGFWLSTYIRQLGVPGLFGRALQVQRSLGTDLQVTVRERVPLIQAKAAIERYQTQMSGGKLLLTPRKWFSSHAVPQSSVGHQKIPKV